MSGNNHINKHFVGMASEHHWVDATNTGTSHHGHKKFGNHKHLHSYNIEHICNLQNFALKLQRGNVCDFYWLITLPDYGNLIPFPRKNMAINHIVPHIQLASQDFPQN